MRVIKDKKEEWLNEEKFTIVTCTIDIITPANRMMTKSLITPKVSCHDWESSQPFSLLVAGAILTDYHVTQGLFIKFSVVFLMAIPTFLGFVVTCYQLYAEKLDTVDH